MGIGSKISLITNAQVRYEGILVEVDPTEKAMTLKDVRSFGSEGRRIGQKEILPPEHDIKMVKFKVDQIKDFKMIQSPESCYEDPAIISASAKSNAEVSVDAPEVQEQE